MNLKLYIKFKIYYKYINSFLKEKSEQCNPSLNTSIL